MRVMSNEEVLRDEIAKMQFRLNDANEKLAATEAKIAEFIGNENIGPAAWETERLAATEAERDKLLQALEYEHRQTEELRRRLRVLLDERNGSVWIWQGDGGDHLESLACPVLIEANQLREIARPAELAEAALAVVEAARSADDLSDCPSSIDRALAAYDALRGKE